MCNLQRVHLQVDTSCTDLHCLQRTEQHQEKTHWQSVTLVTMRVRYGRPQHMVAQLLTPRDDLLHSRPRVPYEASRKLAWQKLGDSLRKTSSLLSALSP